MIEELAKNLVDLKKEFVKVCDSKSQIQEIIPKSKKSAPLLMKAFFSLSIGIFVLSVGGFVVLSFAQSKTQSKVGAEKC